MKILYLVLFFYFLVVGAGIFGVIRYLKIQQDKQSQINRELMDSYYRDSANFNVRTTGPSYSQTTEDDYWTRNNIRQLVGGVEYYYFKNQKLPDSLAQIIDENQFYSESIIQNKPSNNAFTYQRTAPTRFQVCVEFDSNYTGGTYMGYQYYNRQMNFKEVSHTQGVNCYEYDLATIPITVF